MTDSEQSEQTFDVTGLMCPEPVMLLHGKVRELASGTVLMVIATDPSTQRDIPKFCHFLGHDLLQAKEEGSQFIYRIRIVR